MIKTMQCTKCKKDFAVEGGNATAGEVPRTVNCPYCNQPNELLWPKGMGVRIQRLPR